MITILNSMATAGAGNEIAFPGGSLTLAVWAPGNTAFTGSTFTLQIKTSDGTWVTFANTSITTPIAQNLVVSLPPCSVRGFLTGAPNVPVSAALITF